MTLSDVRTITLVARLASHSQATIIAWEMEVGAAPLDPDRAVITDPLPWFADSHDQIKPNLPRASAERIYHSQNTNIRYQDFSS
jgi:hypothetical protein